MRLRALGSRTSVERQRWLDDVEQLGRLTGAFVNPDPVYVQATGFVLDPTDKVLASTYSSGAIGRLVAEDIVGMVKYLQSQA